LQYYYFYSIFDQILGEHRLLKPFNIAFHYWHKRCVRWNRYDRFSSV